MILTYEPDLDKVIMSRHVKYLGQGYFVEKLSYEHTHAADLLLYPATRRSLMNKQRTVDIRITLECCL